MYAKRGRVDGSLVLNPGALRHQIMWQRKNVLGQDASGGDVLQDPWPDVVTCKAEIRSLSGRELELVQQKWAEARYQITQHFVRGLNTDMRVSWFVDGDTKILDILDVSDPVGTSRYQIAIARDYE